jgi:hypothetical protein
MRACPSDGEASNGRAQEEVRGTADEIDFEPVVKLFNSCGAGTWLLTELDPDVPRYRLRPIVLRG